MNVAVSMNLLTAEALCVRDRDNFLIAQKDSKQKVSPQQNCKLYGKRNSCQVQIEVLLQYLNTVCYLLWYIYII